MGALETKVDAVLAAVARIEERLEPIGEDCTGMSNHIRFVHEVYDRFRRPLDYMVEKLGGRRRLPEIEADPPLGDQ